MRHPILVTFDERRLRQQLDRRIRDGKTDQMEIPFDTEGRVLVIGRPDYRRLLRAAEHVLHLLGRRVRPLPTDTARLLAWNDVLAGELKYYDTVRWRVLLTRFARDAPLEAFLEGGPDLALAFVTSALGVGDTRAASAVAADLRARAAPDDSRGRLIRVAFDLQTEADQDAMVRYYAPRVVLFAAGLFPTNAVPVVIGAAITSVVGFLEFMQFIEDAEADGEVTEEEAAEAPWALLGILPFKWVQSGLMLRSVLMLGAALLTALVDALTALPGLIERHLEARENGWGGRVEYDADTVMYVPHSAVGG